jgi:hypothetical protein
MYGNLICSLAGCLTNHASQSTQLCCGVFGSVDGAPSGGGRLCDGHLLNFTKAPKQALEQGVLSFCGQVAFQRWFGHPQLPIILLVRYLTP